MGMYLVFVAMSLTPHFSVLCDDDTNMTKRENVTMQTFVERYLDPKQYHNHVRPGVDEGHPTLVHVDLFIASVGNIDEINMDFTVTMYFRQRWHDKRLIFSEYSDIVNLNYNLYDRLWTPDTQFDNLKQGYFKKITVPNRLIYLYPDGHVYYSQGLTLKLDCEMNLLKFPMDTQVCEIKFSSYAHSVKGILLEWANISNPVQVADFFLAEFDFMGVQNKSCEQTFVTGTFACKYVTLTFSRKLNYYLIQVYIPSTLMVILSWVSFWIDADAVPARVSIGLLTVLTLTTQLSGLSARQPHVSYVKAIDVWMASCMVFVFSSFIQYSAVNVLYRREQRKLEDMRRPPKPRPQTSQNGTHSLYVDPDLDYIYGNVPKRPPRLPDERLCPSPKCLVWNNERYKGRKSVYLDAVSKYVFPSVFLLFSISYWTVYLVIL